MNNDQETKDAIRAELEATRTVFHALLASFSESDLRRQSRNPGWNNGEILTHMTFGFIILMPCFRYPVKHFNFIRF